MTHTIEITVTCDQAEIDRLVALIGTWSADVQRTRPQLPPEQPAMRVHTFLIDGKPAWDKRRKGGDR